MTKTVHGDGMKTTPELFRGEQTNADSRMLIVCYNCFFQVLISAQLSETQDPRNAEFRQRTVQGHAIQKKWHIHGLALTLFPACYISECCLKRPFLKDHIFGTCIGLF